MRGKIFKTGVSAALLVFSCFANAGPITQSATFYEYGERNIVQNNFHWVFDGLSAEIDAITLKFDWAGMDFTDQVEDPDEYFDIYVTNSALFDKQNSTLVGLIGDYINPDDTPCVIAHEGDPTNVWGSDCSGTRTFTLTDISLWSDSTLSLWADNVNYETNGVNSNGFFTDLYPRGYVTASISYEGVEGTVQEVPEPPIYAIFALGMMGIISRKFSKKS